MKINKVEAILVFVTMIQMLFWLHFFEGFTYAHEPNDFLDVTSFIFLSIIGYVLTRIIFSDGSLRAKWIYGSFLFLLILNIGFGFLVKYNRNFHKTGLEHFDSKNNKQMDMDLLYDTKDCSVYGISRRSNNKLAFSRKNINGRSRKETDISYTKLIVPEDYYQYRDLLKIDKSDQINILVEFLEFAFPGKVFFIVDKNNICDEFYYNADLDCTLLIVPIWRGRYLNPIFHELRTGKLKDRIKKYSKTLDELFSPIVVDTTYVNDSYFLIYKGEYKKAKEYLKDLPIERRSFCEEKLRALGELD